MTSSPSPRPAEPSKSRRKEPLLVFVHIQKTAGKTLRQILYRQYGRGHTRLVRNYFVAPDVSLSVIKSLAAEPPSDLRVIHGHILFWPDIEWPEGTQFLTILRDPVERVISHYYWLRARSSRFRKTLEDALIGGSIPDNLQTRVLAAQTPPFGESTDEMLDEALRGLKRLTVVGLTERFDESFVLATRMLEWRRMLYRKENVTPDRKPQDEISAKAIDLIKRYNALDIELYRSASKRFEREVEAQGDGFTIEVEALQRANELVAGLPEDAPIPPLPSTIADANGAASGGLDLRELLIEAQAELLQRDAAIEYLTSVSTPRGAKAVATRTRKRVNPVDQRKAGLDAAIKRATARLENLRKEIRAIEKEGLAGPDDAKLDSLRKAEATTVKRLQGFERRSGKLKTRGAAGETGNGQPAAGGDREEDGPPERVAASPKKDRPKKARRRALDGSETGGPPESRRRAKIEGAQRFGGATPEAVWDILDQPERVARLIPAVESVEIVDDDRWKANVKVPFSFGSRLVLDCAKSDQRRPEHGRLTVRGKGGGAAVTIDGVFDLTESDGGTDLKWQTDVDLSGPVGPMRSRVLKVLVRTQMKNLLGALEREIKVDAVGARDAS